jgi:hypothetical protein
MLMKKSEESARRYGGIGQSGNIPVNEVKAGKRDASEMPAMLFRLNLGDGKFFLNTPNGPRHAPSMGIIC